VNYWADDSGNAVVLAATTEEICAFNALSGQLLWKEVTSAEPIRVQVYYPPGVSYGVALLISYAIQALKVDFTASENRTLYTVNVCAQTSSIVQGSLFNAAIEPSDQFVGWRTAYLACGTSASHTVLVLGIDVVNGAYSIIWGTDVAQSHNVIALGIEPSATAVHTLYLVTTTRVVSFPGVPRAVVSWQTEFSSSTLSPFVSLLDDIFFVGSVPAFSNVLTFWTLNKTSGTTLFNFSVVLPTGTSAIDVRVPTVWLNRTSNPGHFIIAMSGIYLVDATNGNVVWSSHIYDNGFANHILLAPGRANYDIPGSPAGSMIVAVSLSNAQQIMSYAVVVPQGYSQPWARIANAYVIYEDSFGFFNTILQYNPGSQLTKLDAMNSEEWSLAAVNPQLVTVKRISDGTRRVQLPQFPVQTRGGCHRRPHL
jgi:hypothetical protein